MEQKKPSPSRDIADLKARLGLKKGPTPPVGMPPLGSTHAAAPFPVLGGGAQPLPFGAAPSAPAPVSPLGLARPAVPVAVPASAPAPAHDPFAAMKPPQDKTFDLRSIDDGLPATSVRARGSVASLLIGLVLISLGGAVGFGFGAAAIGRRAFNTTNAAARKLKVDLEEIQKVVAQIGTSVAMSQQRLAAEKKEPLSYDPKLIADLAQVKLDPRPDTARIFKIDYYRLTDLAVDRLMNYYYDSIALYGEVERHIKRTTADQTALETFAATQAQRAAGNYGVVFDARGKIVIGSLVEIGAPVCKGSAAECPGDQIEGFQIRANTGAPWTTRKVGPKPEGDKVVPIDRTPLFEAVMSGSPEQVRMELYRNRYNNIRLILARLTGEKKELWEAIDKAAARADLFTF